MHVSWIYLELFRMEVELFRFIITQIYHKIATLPWFQTYSKVNI